MKRRQREIRGEDEREKEGRKTTDGKGKLVKKMKEERNGEDEERKRKHEER